MELWRSARPGDLKQRNMQPVRFPDAKLRNATLVGCVGTCRAWHAASQHLYLGPWRGAWRHHAAAGLTGCFKSVQWHRESSRGGVEDMEVVLCRWRHTGPTPPRLPAAQWQPIHTGRPGLSRIVVTVEGPAGGMGWTKRPPQNPPSHWGAPVGTGSQTERGREWAGRFALTPDPLLEMSRQMGEGVNGCEWSERARPAGLDTV